jgi:integrase/recombinase XerD
VVNLGTKLEKEMKSNDNQNKILTDYKQYLRLEKSLSAQTVEAYSVDLQKLLYFLEDEQIHFLDVKLENLELFCAKLRDIGIHPRSQARILSGIRSFYHFLIIEDYIQADPTQLLELPKIGFHLPEVLSLEEIDSLIDNIDLSTAEGHRNRAMLETLYSCGLRVSELCNLKLSDLYLEEGFIKVEGKGSKQRLVPISQRGINELKNYFIDRNRISIKKGYEDFVFISKRGTNISRIMVFHIIKVLAENIGLQKTISPHTFRHSFATHLLEGGCNLRAIQSMLGHESIATTEIYMHIDRTLLRSEIIEHHPRNRKNIEKHG